MRDKQTFNDEPNNTENLVLFSQNKANNDQQQRTEIRIELRTQKEKIKQFVTVYLSESEKPHGIIPPNMSMTMCHQ